MTSPSPSPSANSPRTPAPRLRSTWVEQPELLPGGPRKQQSVYQAVATARGYTIKAGAATRKRLHRGFPRPDGTIVIDEAGSSPRRDGEASADD
jgi:hypothetical protein